MDYSIFVAYCILYYVIHSVMASNTIKQMVNWSPQKYRLLFNFVAIILLLPGVFVFSKIASHLIFDSLMIKNFIGIGSAIIGTIIVILALKNYDLLEFSGLGAAKPNEQLQVTGLNKYVRHPLYSGIFLLVWGVFIAKSSFAFLVIAVITSIYIFIGTNLEEKKLLEQFGDDYSKYKQRVPMFFPF